MPFFERTAVRPPRGLVCDVFAGAGYARIMLVLLDVSRHLHGPDRLPLLHPTGAPIALYEVLLNALTGTYEGERLTGAQKMDRFTLAINVHGHAGAGSLCPCTPDQVAQLRALVDAMYPTLIYGASMMAMDAPHLHHKDGSRCIDPQCARAHVQPLRTAPAPGDVTES